MTQPEAIRWCIMLALLSGLGFNAVRSNTTMTITYDVTFAQSSRPTTAAFSDVDMVDDEVIGDLISFEILASDGSPPPSGVQEVYSGSESVAKYIYGNKVGCDDVVNSGLTIDRCGVCGGNGASCEVVEGLFRREILKLGYNLVVRIPAGAKRINITELSKSGNYLALNDTNPGGRNYVNSIWGQIQPPKIYSLPGGTYVDYKRPLLTDEGESMIIPGPIAHDINVWLFFQRRNPGISYQYTIPKTRSPEFDQMPSSSSRNLQPQRPGMSTVEHSQIQNHRTMLDVSDGHSVLDGRGSIGSRNAMNGYNPRGHGISPNPFSSSGSTRNRNIYFRGQSTYGRTGVHPINPAISRYSRYRGVGNGVGRYPGVPAQSSSQGSPFGQSPINVPGQRGEQVSAAADNLAREMTNPRREATVVLINRERQDPNTASNPRFVNGRGKQAVETVIRGNELEPNRPTSQSESSSVKWSREGFGPCSKSCAEGRQTVLIKCINRESGKTVDDRYCNDLARPSLIVRKCNRAACPAYYDVGQWSECSRTCGTGRRSRRVVCRQQFPGNFTSVVSHKRCRKLGKPNMHEQCKVQECARWKINSDWSECSVQCGNGKQTRTVVCSSGSGAELPNSKCDSSRPPAAVQTCKMEACITAWFNTDWGSCSANCDTGVQKRVVRCMNTAGLAQGCPAQSKPTDSRSCARASCGDKYEWFTGTWGPCSTDCGTGTQDRRVTCMILSPDGGMRIADSRDSCSSRDQPTTQQSCNTQSCGSRWFYTSWSECSVSCGGGTRDREVWCLDSAGKASATCKESEKPTYQERCNTDHCNVLIDPQCTDLFRSCRMVLQARLCSYPYYQRNCCLSCSQSRSSNFHRSGKGR